MKYLIIVLLLVFISCNNKTKSRTAIISKTVTKVETDSENGIEKSISQKWHNYVESNPEFKDHKIPESEFFHNNKEDANRLAESTLNRKKKASSGLLSLYKQYNDELPKVGTKQIITDFDGRAKAIIENVSVDTIPFNEISKE